MFEFLMGDQGGGGGQDIFCKIDIVSERFVLRNVRKRYQFIRMAPFLRTLTLAVFSSWDPCVNVAASQPPCAAATPDPVTRTRRRSSLVFVSFCVILGHFCVIGCVANFQKMSSVHEPEN